MRLTLRYTRVVKFTILTAVILLGAVPSIAQTIPPRFTQFAWSADGAYVAAVNRAESLSPIVIFTANLEPMTTLQLTNPPEGTLGVDVLGVAWSPDGTRLAATLVASGNRGGLGVFLLVWRTADWSEQLRLVDGGIDGIVTAARSSVVWNPSGTMISTGSEILNAETGQTTLDIIFANAVYWIEWHPTNDDVLFIGTMDAAGAVNAMTGEWLGRYPYYYSPPPDVSPNGQRLAVMSSTEDVARIVDIVDTATFQRVTSIHVEGYYVSEADGIDWLSDNLLSLTVGIEGGESTLIYDVTTGTVVDTVVTNAFNVWNEQGTQFVTRRIAVQGNEADIAVFDGVTEGLVAQYSDQPTVRSLAVTDASGTVVSNLLSGEGIINDISATDAANALVQAFTYPETVGSVAFDVDGTRTIDNSAPFTFPLPSEGDFVVQASPYSAADGEGELGLQFSVNIHVVQDESTATPSPTSTPILICTSTIATSDALGLVNAITNANSNGISADILCLAANSTYSFSTASNAIALPSITTPITIVGNGAILERANGSLDFRLFNVTNTGSLTLQDLTLRGGNAGSANGGAILNAGTVSLTNITLSDNASGASGGAIFNNINAILTVSDSIFSGNTATTSGGAIYSNTNATLAITNSTFANNGVNTTSGSGGALFNNGSLTITDSIFNANSARNGGGILVNNTLDTAQITDTTLQGNTAANQGGGLYVVTGNVAVTGGSILANQATGAGGGIRNGGTLTLENVAVADNTSANSGAGIYNNASLTLTDNTFNNNHVTNINGSGGGLYSTTGTTGLTGGTLSNGAARNGAGIYVGGGSVLVTGTSLLSNTSSNHGGGLYVLDGASATLDFVTLSGNSAVNQGGAISNGGTLSVQNSLLMTNSASGQAGALYTTIAGSNTLQNSCLSGNTSPLTTDVFSQASGFNATQNWWGADTGPTASMVNANVVFAPFLTGGCPSNVGAGGSAAQQAMAPQSALMQDMQAEVQAAEALGEIDAASVENFVVEEAPIQAIALPYSTSFDTEAGWNGTGTWTFNVLEGRNGGTSWIADTTIRDQESILEASSTFNLSDSAQPQLHFWQQAQLSASDTIIVEVLPQGTDTWVTVDVQVGMVTDWAEHVVSLSAYQGQVIRLRIRVSALGELPANISSIGYSVDDVSLVNSGS